MWRYVSNYNICILEHHVLLFVHEFQIDWTSNTDNKLLPVNLFSEYLPLLSDWSALTFPAWKNDRLHRILQAVHNYSDSSQQAPSFVSEMWIKVDFFYLGSLVVTGQVEWSKGFYFTVIEQNFALDFGERACEIFAQLVIFCSKLLFFVCHLELKTKKMN